MMLALIGFTLSITGKSFGQDVTLLWLANSTLSPTRLPSYGGQPSPFQRGAQTEQVASNRENEAKRLARIQAIQKAESILNSSAAIVPMLSSLIFSGRIVGNQGIKVFYNNQWVSIGSQVSAPMQISTAARQALYVLGQQDVQAAEELQRHLEARLVKNGSLKLTLSAINEASVTLKSTKENFEIPLQRSGL